MIKKILIVDDEQDILEPISLLLDAEGYLVETTPKGEEIFAKVKYFKPDLILLDILISGSDGRLICKKLKKNDKTKNISVVIMSAHPSAQLDAKNCGAEGFLAKPFEIDELLDVISNNLN